jgi:NAD(P)H-nitrite reductase large subunit
MIIDGKIKLKNDSQIAEFTETGIKFENGSELPADVVVFATGSANEIPSLPVYSSTSIQIGRCPSRNAQNLWRCD